MSSHRLCGDFNPEKLSLSTQYGPGGMDTSEAVALGLHLKNKKRIWNLEERKITSLPCHMVGFMWVKVNAKV